MRKQIRTDYKPAEMNFHMTVTAVLILKTISKCQTILAKSLLNKIINLYIVVRAFHRSVTSQKPPGSSTRDLEKTNMSCRILKALTANCKISLPFCSKDCSAELQRFMLDALQGESMPKGRPTVLRYIITFLCKNSTTLSICL